MIDQVNRDTHQLPIHEVLLLLETDASRGLNHDEARRRLQQFGPNVLPSVQRHGPFIRFLLQFHYPLIYILLGATIITALLGEWVDSSVIFGVVLVNAVVGFIQESRAERALEALMTMVKTEATVLREGNKHRVPSADVVPGDLVLLQSGDKVPADLRLVSIHELQVDESALTGESVPVVKEESLLSPDTALADRRNMVYSGTLVTYGQGVGVAVGTGPVTEIGRIHQLIGSATDIATPLTKKIAHFSKILTVVILGLAAVTFGIGVWWGQPVVEMFMAAVALAVGAIPEGLPAAVTITLAIGVNRMAKRHVLIRKLPAVETLGSTTVICSDKTGTLTENQMTVQAILAGGQEFEVSGTGYEPMGDISHDGKSIDLEKATALRECLLAGMLCNDTQLMDRDNQWMIVGDPTEGALLAAAQKAGLDEWEVSKHSIRVDVIPFESQRQYMATLHHRIDNSSKVIYMKGAMEKVLSLCTQELGPDGRERPCDLETISQHAQIFGECGLRLLGFAKRIVSPETDTLDPARHLSGLTWLGLQGMMDPPRSEAIRAAHACQSAGIAVKMITGDHAVTAKAIAQEIGLDRATVINGEGPRIMTGSDLAAYPVTQLPDNVNETIVFARVAPEQKLRIVDALQARGHIVAMTGDGVNDAPALKQADVGVAMGRGGTEVAKEAADMILTDDNFASIEAAVEEGRGVFDNLTKFIIWTLPTNLGEGLVILAAIGAGLALPILPVQILWINMTTAVALGLMLVFEPKEAGIMVRPPRDPKRPLLTGELVWRILLVGTLLLVGAFGMFLWVQARGDTLEEARTTAVNVFVMVELLYLFNCRSLQRPMFQLGVFSNPWVTGGVLIMITLQLLFTYAPSMNFLFHTAPIGLETWVPIIGIGLGSYFIVEIEKWVRQQRAASQTRSR
ncbi:MAG: putative cation-transporting ATPase F [Nitrospirales bacterium]|nr:MAG: putative cation-transporting ATPase F [Nitrospirales bacterium]